MELTVTAKPNETPEQQMVRLGQMYKQIMAGRIDAMGRGLMAIHNQLAVVSRQIEDEQARLLTVNPELVMMAMAETL